jgi:broad specificity phosphatase PhoE
MVSEIYIVRHAESEHNVSKDFSQLDPPLTSLGLQQAHQLSHTLPDPSSVAIILCSPLRRAIQTTLAGFSEILDKRYFAENSTKGVIDGAILLMEPDLQERSDLPCDTGSPADELTEAFPRLDFDGLDDSWPAKTDRYGPDDAAVRDRAGRVITILEDWTEKLSDDFRKNIIVVTHGVFMKFLTGDLNIDLPKAGWRRYGLQKQDQEGKSLVARDST